MEVNRSATNKFRKIIYLHQALGIKNNENRRFRACFQKREKFIESDYLCYFWQCRIFVTVGIITDCAVHVDLCHTRICIRFDRLFYPHRTSP